jgi:hypothetical protein
MASDGNAGVNGLTQEQMQDVLGRHISEQLARIEESDSAARAVQDQNAKKVQGAIDNALARALMGKTDKAKTEGVKFPQEVFDLAVALSQQPQLLPPVLAFYQRMRDRINAAVAEALAEFGGADVDQGKKSNPADAGTTQQ